jgi:integrase
MGHLFRPKLKDKNGRTRESPFWFMQIKRDGKRIVESTECKDHKAARKVLRDRLDELDSRRPSTRDLSKVTFEDLCEIIRADYTVNDRKSSQRLERSLGHLKRSFGGWRVLDISEGAIERYKADRKVDGASNASINRELAALKRMYRLGKKQKKVQYIPEFDKLTENNRRHGFFEDDVWQKVEAELPWQHRAWATFQYWTGWRTYKDVLSLTWDQVDFNGGWIRLPAEGTTKRKKARQFPMIPQLHVLLKAQQERKALIEEERGIVIKHVFFHPWGAPIKSFRKAWESALKRAKLEHRPGERLTPHDFRRTAARNQIRMGVAQAVVKKLIGWESDKMFEHYFITDETILEEAGNRMAQSDGQSSAKVKPLRAEAN